VWLNNLWAMVRVVSGWRVNSWCLLCQVVAEVVGKNGYVVVMVADDMGCC
jgi:hypothetical protein